MDGLITEIKTVKTVQNNVARFESLSLDESRKPRSNGAKPKQSMIELSPPSTKSTGDSLEQIRPSRSYPASKQSQPATKTHKRHDSTAFLQKTYLQRSGPTSLPDDAREILRSQPDQEDLKAVLQYLQYGIRGKHDFNILISGPQASQILNVLVTITIPDQWHILTQSEVVEPDKEMKKLLVSSLRSVAGIGALLMQVRQFGASRENNLLLRDILSVLDNILHGSQTLHSLLQDATSLYTKDTQRRVFWQEVVALLCGSKVLSTISQAAATNPDLNLESLEWLCDGSQYSTWLAKNISHCALSLDTNQAETWTMLSQAMKRSMSLGYRDAFISSLYLSLLFGSRALWTPLHQLLNGLSPHEQRVFFDSVLSDLVRKHMMKGSILNGSQDNVLKSENAVGGVAAMISSLVQNNKTLEEHVENWLTDTSGEYATFGLDTRRALLATMALRQDKLQRILDKCLDSFGDKLQIQHAPILQQEAMAEIILLAIGYLHRLDTQAVQRLSKSAIFLQSVSNRLAASIPRARVLGMVVAVAISKLVDAPNKVMNFGSDEMEEEYAKRLLALTQVSDKVGSIEDLEKIQEPKETASTIAVQVPQPKRKVIKKPSNAPKPTSKIIAIEELSSSESEDPDLRPYAKPDCDASDSEDDPTLINRSKPSAPVYIIDLLSQLNTVDKPEITELALRTAPDLIRRKAKFGTELSENVQAVASSLLNLKDDMDEPAQQELRLQALIACVASKPHIIAPWLASTYFEGDLSMAQRATLLTTLGLGARELSGHKPHHPPTHTPALSNDTSFPSKRLPPHLSTLYSSPLKNTAAAITQSTLQPLALAAADKVSGPDILKIRTFSSRMAVQKRTATQQSERSKRIPKDIHVLLTNHFYLPLCGRLTLLLSTPHTNLSRSNIFDPTLVSIFLHTLTIILHALGPNAVQLGEVSRETMALLVNLHNAPVLAYDPVVLPACLQFLLLVVDLNVDAGPVGEERLVTDLGEMVAQVINWAAGLAEGGEGGGVPVLEMQDDRGRGEGRRTGGGGVGGGGSMPWPVLLAGIQVKWHEVGRKFQGRMMGLMGGEDAEMEF